MTRFSATIPPIMWVSSIAIVAAIACTSGVAAAQTNDADNIDIVVTAQKRSERLQDVPISISALSAAELQTRGIQSVASLETTALAGLRISRQAGSGQPAIVIRGISTSAQTEATREQGTALYIDGVYIPRPQGLTSKIIDPERIEVLRGPQGTLFGRNAEGGALSITSAGPTGEFGGRIGATIGSFGMREEYVRLNLPEFANIAIRVDGVKTDFDGFVKNKALAPGQTLSRHRDFGEQDNIGGRVQVRWTPSSDFSAQYSYDNTKLDYTQEYIYRIGFPLGARQVDPSRVRESWIPLWVGGFKTRIQGHALTTTYDVSDNLQVKSITAYRKVTEDGANTLNGANTLVTLSPTRRVSGIIGQGFVSSKAFSQEIQLIGSLPRLEYAIGAFYFREKVIDRRTTMFSIVYNGTNPPVAVEPFILAGGATQASARATSFAIFGQATYTPAILDDQLKLTLGLRYTDDEKVAQRDALNGVILSPPRYTSPVTESRFDPAFTIAYQPNSDFNLYARYAQAFRAGGIAITSPAFTPFNAETNRQVELGLKSQLFDRHVQFNIAAWHSWVKDRQTNVVDPINPSIIDTKNIPGTSKLRGIEVETVADPLDGLKFTASGSIQSGKEPPYNCGPTCDRRFLTFMPRWIIGLAGDYSVPVGDMELALHLDWNYTTPYHKAPVYNVGQVTLRSQDNVWNSRVTLSDLPLGPVKAKLSLAALNLLNNKNIVTDTNLNWGVRQQPRQIQGTLEIEF